MSISTHFEPRSVFSSYPCRPTLYDIIGLIFCDPPTTSIATPTPATLPTPKSGGTLLPTPKIDAFPQILVCPPNIDDKSTPMIQSMIELLSRPSSSTILLSTITILPLISLLASVLRRPIGPIAEFFHILWFLFLCGGKERELYH